MPNTMTLIASSTVGSGGASSIDFTSIPSTYTDLCLKFSVRTNGIYVVDNLGITFNGSTSSYSLKRLRGNGSTVASASPSYTEAAVGTGGAATSSTFGSGEVYIPNYAGSTNKSYSADSVTENNGTEAWVYMTAGLWSNTAAINQVTLTQASGSFLQYSTAYLYGVKNA